MIRPYPYFGFPNFRRPYPYYSNYNNYNNLHNSNVNTIKNVQTPCSPKEFSKKEQGNFACSSNSSNLSNLSTKDSINYKKIEECDSDIDSSEECFEIFGLKLYFDDLLIVAMLFFLYQEDVKDTYLYIALILLLLS